MKKYNIFSNLLVVLLFLINGCGGTSGSADYISVDNSVSEVPSVSIKYTKNLDNSYKFFAEISNVSEDSVISYLWNFGDNITETDVNNLNEPVVNFKSVGTYNIGLTCTIDNKEYSDSISVNITQIAQVIPNAEIKYVQNADYSYTFSVVISEVSSNEVTDYIWDFGDNITVAGEIKGETVTVSFKNTGKYDTGLTYTVNGKKFYASTQVIVNKVDGGTVTISYKQSGDSQYNFYSELKGFTDTKNAVYSWNFGGDINEVGQNNIASPLISYKSIDGIKKVVLTVTVSGREYVSNTLNIYLSDFLTAGGGFTAGHTKTFMFAVKNGKLYGWGIIPGGSSTAVTTPKLISGIPDNEYITSISAGEKHVLFLSESGKVYSMGRNEEGQLGFSDLSKINSYPEEITALSGKKIVKILAKINVSYAVDENGRLYSWGSNSGGILGTNNAESQSAVPEEVTFFSKNNIKVEDISYGNNIVIVLGSDKQVYGWGDANDYGTNGHGAGIELREPKLIDKLKGINAVQAVTDVFSSFMVSSTGEVYSWGWNLFGELGETRSDVTIPDKIDILLNIREVVKAKYTVFAIDNKDEVYSWGTGQLGRNGSSTPAKISGLTNINKVYSVYDTGYAVTNDGLLYGWGDDFCSQIGDNNPYGTVQTPKQITTFKDSTGQDIKTAIKVKEVIDLEGTTYLITEDYRLFSAGCNSDGETGTGKVSEYIAYFTEISFP